MRQVGQVRADVAALAADGVAFRDGGLLGEEELPTAFPVAAFELRDVAGNLLFAFQRGQREEEAMRLQTPRSLILVRAISDRQIGFVKRRDDHIKWNWRIGFR